MSSRERVLQSLQHKDPTDRPPIEIGSTDASGISIKPYIGIKQKLGIDTPSVMYNVKQGLAQMEPVVRDILGGDLMPVRLKKGSMGIDISQLKPWQTPDGSKCFVGDNFNPIRMPDGSYELRADNRVVARLPEGGYYFESNYPYPLRNANTQKEIRDALPIIAPAKEIVDELVCEANRLRNESDKALILGGDGCLFDRGRQLWTFERYMMMFYDSPKLLEYALDRIVEQCFIYYDAILPAISKYIDIIWFADDLGTQTGLCAAPDIYRKFIFPRHKRIIEHIKYKCECAVMLHSDGAFYELIPDIIDAGFDILNPLQYNAPGMEPVRIKKNFGKDLCFLGGGCETQHILPYGSPEQVCEEARRMLDILLCGGGYIFAAVHNILADVPAENVLALFNTARKWPYT